MVMFILFPTSMCCYFLTTFSSSPPVFNFTFALFPLPPSRPPNPYHYITLHYFSFVLMFVFYIYFFIPIQTYNSYLSFCRSFLLPRFLSFCSLLVLFLSKQCPPPLPQFLAFSLTFCVSAHFHLNILLDSPRRSAPKFVFSAVSPSRNRQSKGRSLSST